MEWYETVPQDDRANLQKEFGNHGVTDRETKFYRWLISEKKYKKEKP